MGARCVKVAWPVRTKCMSKDSTVSTRIIIAKYQGNLHDLDEALRALQAEESEAAANAAAPADEGASGAPPHGVSLACVG